jgi:hypothetical protein
MDATAATIEIQVEDLSQLFDSLDPFPFRERDLDKSAEEYIVGWAREIGKNQDIEIVIHVPQKAKDVTSTSDIQSAIQSTSLTSLGSSIAISANCFASAGSLFSSASRYSAHAWSCGNSHWPRLAQKVSAAP